jgi:hypothetical protein
MISPVAFEGALGMVGVLLFRGREEGFETRERLRIDVPIVLVPMLCKLAGRLMRVAWPCSRKKSLKASIVSQRL